MARARRLAKAFALITAGLVLGFSLYVGFIQAGVIRNPFSPVLRGDIEAARGDRPGLRVLFVGNSLTYYNSMPEMVQELAAADPEAEPIFAVWYTRPGWSLRGASADDRLASLLRDVRWNAVVLQEHSVVASERPEESEPFAKKLHQRIGARGARTVLFVTWWYRHHSDLASRLSVRVAPFAPAWDEALRRRPDLDLMGPDGRHPNRAGSYLAACVFYATLTGRDPSKSSFTAGLEKRDARHLQRVAAEVSAHA
ncbi:MAG: hypothetical protein ACRDKU_06900 [Gaiellaceae bacterium]